MVNQVCEAMQFIANKGVVHRDLAARNIQLFSKLDATDPSSVNVKVCTRSRVKAAGPGQYNGNWIHYPFVERSEGLVMSDEHSHCVLKT